MSWMWFWAILLQKCALTSKELTLIGIVNKPCFGPTLNSHLDSYTRWHEHPSFKESALVQTLLWAAASLLPISGTHISIFFPQAGSKPSRPLLRLPFKIDPSWVCSWWREFSLGRKKNALPTLKHDHGCLNLHSTAAQGWRRPAVLL